MVGADGLVVTVIDPAWAIDAAGQSVLTRYRIEGTTLIQVIDHHDATYPVVGDPKLKGCRWWEIWCHEPIKRCTSTGTKAAVVGAVGGGVAAIWTGPAVPLAAGAGGIAGAVSGCIAGLFGW